MNKMDVKKYYGPGYWAVMHIDAHNATTFSEKNRTASTIVRMISTFPCKTCREHGITYAANNPLIHAVNDTDPLSVFRWVWRFHNAVNRKIGKAEISLDYAINLWSGKTFCIDQSCE